MLIAIEDADRLLKYANAPKDIVYNSIVRNMFKNIDDMATFETCLNNDSANRDLRRIINNMKKGGSFTKVEDLNSLISKKMFKDAYKKYHKKAKEFEELTYTLEKNYEKALEDKKKELESEMIKNNQNYKEVNERINLENGKLISTNKVPNIRSNFLIEDDYIRRGQDIFELSENDWICIGSFKITNDAHYDFIGKVISAYSLLDVKIYENGIFLNDIENQKTIIVNDISNENEPVYKIMSNEFVIPSIVLEKIYAFMYFTSNIYKDNTSFNINTLIYNDKPLNLLVQSDNVYSLSLDGDFSELDKISGMFKNFECSDFNKVVEKSNEIREQVKSKKYS